MLTKILDWIIFGIHDITGKYVTKRKIQEIKKRDPFIYY
jgi:hypothetical protein